MFMEYSSFALLHSYRQGREKFLGATPIYGLLGMALRKIRCGASKCRCGIKEINVVEVIRLIEVKEIDSRRDNACIHYCLKFLKFSCVALRILGVALTVVEKGVVLIVGETAASHLNPLNAPSYRKPKTVPYSGHLSFNSLERTMEMIQKSGRT